MTIQEINAALEIIRLNGQRFLVPGGYIQPDGYYTLKHPTLGYVGFACDHGKPYMPVGRRTALQCILDAGGFDSFEGMVWVQEMR
jgi:hypothetical protein